MKKLIVLLWVALFMGASAQAQQIFVTGGSSFSLNETFTDYYKQGFTAGGGALLPLSSRIDLQPVIEYQHWFSDHQSTGYAHHITGGVNVLYRPLSIWRFSSHLGAGYHVNRTHTEGMYILKNGVAEGTSHSETGFAVRGVAVLQFAITDYLGIIAQGNYQVSLNNIEHLHSVPVSLGVTYRVGNL